MLVHPAAVDIPLVVKKLPVHLVANIRVNEADQLILVVDGQLERFIASETKQNSHLSARPSLRI